MENEEAKDQEVHEVVGSVSEDDIPENMETLMERRDEEKKEIIEEVRKKHPNIPLFSVTLPYNGTFIIRPQDMADVKTSSQKVEEFVNKKITELGGYDVIQKLEEMDRATKMKEVDAEAADISNDIALSRCVLYPFDFAEKMETGEGIPAGIVPLLLDKILEVSGWQDVQVEEI